MNKNGDMAQENDPGEQTGVRALRLTLVESSSPWDEKATVRDIIHSYSDLIIRSYCMVRFRVIPTRFLDELSQYIPDHGRILDLGCGFGLFSLFFAITHPKAQFVGVDVSASRVQTARLSAKKLGVENVEFLCNDARNTGPNLGGFDTVITLDLMHHIPVMDGDSLIQTVHRDLLMPEGRFLLKDVTTHPRSMLYFTFLLDLFMNPKASFFYRDVGAWTDALYAAGFLGVERHYLWDILPYPHILLVAQKGKV